MALTIQERLKDLRVERGLTLEQLAPMDKETADLFQQLAKKMIEQTGKEAD